MTLSHRGERIGLVVNPSAAGGRSDLHDIVRRLLERMEGQPIYVLDDTIEHATAVSGGISVHSVPHPQGPVDASATARRLLRAGVSGLVGVGGDGTLCDIASALRSEESGAWLLGVGIGSANVGPLVGVRGRAIDTLRFDHVREIPVHGVEAFVRDMSLGVAFNDVALANTYFGTRDGQRVDLDAVAKLMGEDRVGVPSPVCGTATWIRKNGYPILPAGTSTLAQIVASPINDPQAHAGLAVSGLLCWGPYVGLHAVLAATSSVMIRTRLTEDDVAAAEPLQLMHIGFGDEDRVEVGQLQPNAVVILDGNPVCRLTSADVVTLRVRMNAIRTLRPAQLFMEPERAN